MEAIILSAYFPVKFESFAVYLDGTCAESSTDATAGSLVLSAAVTLASTSVPGTVTATYGADGTIAGSFTAAKCTDLSDAGKTCP